MTGLVFEYIRHTRKAFTDLIDGLDIDRINAIPPGFRNNIGWNFGHIVVSTQGLCYLRTAVQPDKAVPFLSLYGKGTKPETWIDEAEIAILRTQAVETIDQLERDYQNGLFATVKPFATDTYGVPMNTIEEVITVTLAHDNLHLGYAWAIRRVLEENK